MKTLWEGFAAVRPRDGGEAADVSTLTGEAGSTESLARAADDRNRKAIRRGEARQFARVAAVAVVEGEEAGAAEARDEALHELFRALILGLDGPRTRAGKLDIVPMGNAGEPLRELAVKYKVGPSADRLGQAVAVLKAAYAALMVPAE